MAAQDILAAVSGALKGGAEGYMFNREEDYKNRKLDSDSEIKRLQTEIKVMLENMKEQGRNQRWETPSGNVTATQEGQNTRWLNPSGNVIANNRTRERGQDLGFSLGLALEDGRNNRWSTPSGNAIVGADTSRRGQDLSAETARRGQDISAATAAAAEAGRGTRATDANALREKEIEARERLERLKRQGNSGSLLGDAGRDGLPAAPGMPPADIELPDTGTGRPTAEPIEIVPQAGPPVTPRSPEASADESSRLSQQATSLLQQFKTEADPAKKRAIGAQLRRLREQ
ncbi:MAG: hypothetical protein AB7O67_23250, partial [Vicinamibacterales bacterium]